MTAGQAVKSSLRKFQGKHSKSWRPLDTGDKLILTLLLSQQHNPLHTAPTPLSSERASQSQDAPEHFLQGLQLPLGSKGTETGHGPE